MPINGPVQKLIGKKFLGVTIDDSPELRKWLLEAEETNHMDTFAEKLAYLEILVERLRNAKSLSHDPALLAEKQLKFHDLVWKPSQHPNLSEALQLNAACCRYYHVLFFVLATYIKLGLAATVYGKMLPGQNFGYTWVVVKDPDGNDIVVDLYKETIRYPEDRYDDPSGKYQDGQPYAGYENDERGFRFITFE